MNLTCVVRHSPEPPLVIYWTHDHEVRYYQVIKIHSFDENESKKEKEFQQINFRSSSPTRTHRVKDSNLNPLFSSLYHNSLSSPIQLTLTLDLLRSHFIMRPF